MNLLIVGANGKLGLALVRQACDLGHNVTALVHHAPTQSMHCAHVLCADARDPSILDSAVANQQAIIDTIGTRKPFLKTTLETDVARNLVASMQRHNVRRILAVSSLGVGDSAANINILFRALIPTFFRGAMPDKAGMESQLRSSGLDFTIVRPAGLTDGPPTGAVQVVTPKSRRHVRRISRDDVAAFILHHLADPALHGATVGIATS